MPPKKSKEQQISQTITTTTKQSAAQSRGRKRKNSDASVASSQSVAVASGSGAAPKRRKQRAPEGQIALPNVQEAEAIAEQDPEPVYPQLDDDVQVSHTSTKLVHFDEVESDGELRGTTASHITPHPRKVLSIKRRVTASPAVHNGHSKNVEIKTSRMSLPPSLSQEEEAAAFDVEEMSLKYVPLHVALEERVERRLQVRRLNQAIRAKQQEGDASGVLELQKELAALMPKNTYLSDVDNEGGVNGGDEEMLVLASQKVTYPSLPKVEIDEERSELIRDVAVREPAREESFTEVERRRLKDAILSLSAEAEQAKEEKKLLEQELMGLGLAADNIEDSSLIMTSIRESFADIRTSIEALLPGEIDETYSNVEVVRFLMANVQEFAGRLQKQDKAMQDRTSIIDDLSRQINGLLDLLATSKDREEKLLVELETAEARVQTLEKRFTDLDKATEGKERENEELQEELDALEKDRDETEKRLTIKAQESRKYYAENLEYARDIVRLNESLKDYQSEASRLEKSIFAVEKESREHQATILGLQRSIELIEKEKEDKLLELTRVSTLYAEVCNTRDVAEEELREKTQTISDLEVRVDQLEVKATELSSELNKLQGLNATERSQREEAESELDKAIEESDGLNKTLQTKGAEANQLRQKLFEVQQKSQQKVQTLEEEASLREDQYQNDIAQEVTRREEAEALIDSQASEIQQLQARLDELDEEMNTLLAERDSRIKVFEADAEIKSGELLKLRDDLDKAVHDAAANVEERNQIKKRLQTEITILEGKVAEHANTITAMDSDAINTASLHDSEMEDFRARVAELNETIGDLRTAVDELEKQKHGLEKRVETEAEEALTIQAGKDDEIDGLTQEILNKEQQIANIDEKAQQADLKWQALLKAREEEIATLRTTGETREEEVTTLSMSLEALKTKFTEYVRRMEQKFTRVQEAAAAHKAIVDEEAADAEGDSAQMLEEIASMSFVAEMTVSTKTTTTNTQEPKTPAKKTRGKKKRVQDSGFYEPSAEGDGAIAI